MTKNTAALSATGETYDDPLHGIVYFKHPGTGKLALYISFELEPDHEYSVRLTSDGVNYTEIERRSTKGLTHDIYESFNVPDPGNGLWPAIIDLGPSPA